MANFSSSISSLHNCKSSHSSQQKNLLLLVVVVCPLDHKHTHTHTHTESTLIHVFSGNYSDICLLLVIVQGKEKVNCGLWVIDWKQGIIRQRSHWPEISATVQTHMPPSQTLLMFCYGNTKPYWLHSQIKARLDGCKHTIAYNTFIFETCSTVAAQKINVWDPVRLTFKK